MRHMDIQQVLKMAAVLLVSVEKQDLWELSPHLCNETQRLKREMTHKTWELKSCWSCVQKTALCEPPVPPKDPVINGKDQL